jgi:hypothetical protein
VAGDIENRASLARWKWKAEKARAAVSANFSNHGQKLVGEWCGYDESTTFSNGTERLGSAAGRIIQRWPTKRQFIEATKVCGQTCGDLGYVYVLVMDVPDAAWMRVRGELLCTELAPAAAEWLTDGFIAFDPDKESLLSVDVEERGGASYIETTIIGEAFRELRDCFNEHGPAPLTIVDRSADEHVR